MENVSKYPIPGDNPPSYDVAVGNNQAEYQYPSITPQNPNISQSATSQQFQYHHQPPLPSQYPQIPPNYQVVTVVPPQSCILAADGTVVPRKKEIPRNIKIISYIGCCVCIFLVLMIIRDRI